MSELFEAMAMNIIMYASTTVTLSQMYELSHMMWSIATPTSLIAYTCILLLSLSLHQSHWTGQSGHAHTML